MTMVSGSEVIKQHTRCAALVLLTGREHQANGKITLVDHRIDLRAQSPTRATYGVICAPFLPSTHVDARG